MKRLTDLACWLMLAACGLILVGGLLVVAFARIYDMEQGR